MNIRSLCEFICKITWRKVVQTCIRPSQGTEAKNATLGPWQDRNRTCGPGCDSDTCIIKIFFITLIVGQIDLNAVQYRMLM